MDVFLGHVDFRAKRVLDVGPANGFFSFEIEKRGGAVTAVDLGQNSPWDVVPHRFADEETLVANMRQNVRKVENAFWFAHQALKSQVKLVYGSVYDVPKVAQRVDVALMSNVLQHFRDPALAIQRVSQVVEETMVITETVWHDDPTFLQSSSMHFIPRAWTPEVNHSWYQTSPAFVIELLKLLGFPDIKMEFHQQKFNGASADFDARMVKHFTITARRAHPLNPAQLTHVNVDFASGFHGRESDAKHSWRWSPGPRAEIHLANASAQNVVAGLSFGMASSKPNAKIRVSVQGKVVWECTSFFGTQPGYVPSITLLPGKNVVELTTDSEPSGPTPQDGRALNFALHDFTLCQPGGAASAPSPASER